VVADWTVTVYPDRSAGDWSPPIASNPYLTNDLAGWRESPFSPVWHWAGGQAVGGTALSRSDTAPVFTPAGATAYRIRLRFTIDRRDDVYWGISFGKDAHAAWAGPYWVAAGDAVQLWGAQTLDAGTYTIEQTWNPGGADIPWPDPAVYPYLGPRISWSANTVGSLDSIELAYVGAAGVDFTCLCDSVTINHGRDDTTSQPEASSATIELSRDAFDRFPLPVELEIGAVVKVVALTATTSSQRFVGRVTDLTLGWDDLGEDTPEGNVGQVVCTGLLDDPGRRVIGDVPWPQELDGARVARVMAAAGITLDPQWSDPGTVQILARDVDSQPALDVARGVAADAGGLVWETRNGDIRYADAEHRRGTHPTLQLDACDLLVTPSWRRTLEGLINDVSIGYGPTPDEGEQPRVLMTNAASKAKWGTYGFTTATQLAALADAQAMASMLTTRNAAPVWVMAALPVDVGGLDAARYDALLNLDVHALLSLTGLPSTGTAPTSAALWVEGWRETLEWGTHGLELVVSGYCRTAPAPRWDDVDPSWTWNTVPADLTWDGATCFGPPVALGRWTDVPASLRWDAVAPGITWDTWPY
jgi:hypothetical protein